ncbi:MAG: PAS domain S-box protein [Pseudomonadota bacterium]
MNDAEKSKAERVREPHEESKMTEELYRSLLNSSADAIIVYDMDGRVRYVNRSFERMFGWSLEEVEGIRIPYVPETDREPTMAIIGDLIRNGTPCSGFETRRYTADGTVLHVSISASRYHDHEGRPAGMLAILRDISDMRRAQDELRRSEENHRALYVESERLRKHYLTLLDASPEPLVVYDDNGIPLYINPAFSRVFGWTFDELKGRRIDFVPPENIPETRDMIDTVLRGEAFSGRDSRRYTKCGEIIDVSVSGAVFFDENDRRTGSVVHLRDITERKRAQAKLKAELNKFQVLYDLALAMIAERSLEEIISLVVEKSRELLGVDKAYIALRDETHNELVMHTLSGTVTRALRETRIPFGVGLGGKVAETGMPCIVEDYERDVGTVFQEVARAESLLSGMAVPVKTGPTNLGVLYAFNSSKTVFSRSDLDTLSLLANLAAVEITGKRAEARLREREESYRKLYEESKRREELYVSLLNSSADAIVIYDVEGRTQYVNPVFTRIFGWSMDEVLGKQVPFLPEGEREATMSVISDLMRNGKPCSAFETKRYTKDGRILDVSISASRTLDHEGVPVGTLAILRNISDRKKAEAEIKESEERFRTLAETGPFGLVVIAADGRTEYVNPKFTEITGYTIEDLPDTEAWFGKVYLDDRSGGRARSVWYAEKVEIRLRHGIGTEAAPRVFRARCKDGTQKTVSFRAVFLAGGRLISTFLDVTAEVEAQREIIRAKNEWERTFNSVSDLILILDRNQAVVRANKALAERLGVLPEDLVGMDCRKGPDKERIPAVFSTETGMLSPGEEYWEEVVDDALGAVFDLRVSPLVDEKGELIGSVNVARDITAFKSMERARRRAVHHLSHELKTPLAVIKSTVKHLGGKDLSAADREERLERVRRNLQRLTDIQEIVQEIAAPRRYEPCPFPIVATVDEILDEVRKAGSHREVALISSIDDFEADTVDPYILQECLVTLLKNAIENTPDEGEVRIRMSKGPKGVLLQVEDGGVGISASDREFVFRAFYHTQTTSSYSTRNPYDFNAGGKGLELMRLKILSEGGAFRINFDGRRCRHLLNREYECPGRISLCRHVSGPEDCRKSGGTVFSVLFCGPTEKTRRTGPGDA